MDVFDAFQKRHSYRGLFTEDPVPRDDLISIVEAGRRAPSGCNAQTTGFVIVDETSRINRVREYVPNGGMRNPPALIAVLAQEEPVYQGLAFMREDYGAAVENMLLAVTALGYASVWIDGVLRFEDRANHIARILDISEPWVVRVILPVGRPAKGVDKPKERLPWDERVWFNSQGGGS
jgi:nitroreductase